MRIVDSLFRLEEINGGNRCPTYLYRWTLFQPRWWPSFWRGFGVYVHHFVGDDWSLDLHDHPKRFVSLGLKGSYVETTPNRLYHDFDRATNAAKGYDYCKVCGWQRGGTMMHSRTVRTVYRAPWIRTFPAEHIHRLELLRDGTTCWTLVVVLRHVREWGFWHEGSFIHWRDYVKGKASHIADAMRACR